MFLWPSNFEPFSGAAAEAECRLHLPQRWHNLVPVDLSVTWTSAETFFSGETFSLIMNRDVYLRGRRRAFIFFFKKFTVLCNFCLCFCLRGYSVPNTIAEEHREQNAGRERRWLGDTVLAEDGGQWKGVATVACSCSVVSPCCHV